MKAVKEMLYSELVTEWCARQVEVDAEIASRATRAWVHQDVFGEVRHASHYDPKPAPYVGSLEEELDNEAFLDGGR
jgi:hypothetical protein